MEEKKYKLTDAIKILYSTSPLNFSLLVGYTVLNALIPAYQTITIGLFIDTALKIFNDNAPGKSIIVPAVLMLGSFIFINLMPPIMRLPEVILRNKLEYKLHNQLIMKQMNLNYQHIENSDTLNLINRTYKNAVSSFMTIFSTILNFTGIAINIVSLLIIIMKYSYLVGLVIFMISIPLLYKSMGLGQEIYKMGIDVNKIKRRYQYLDKILTSREFSTERNLFQFTRKLTDSYKELYDASYSIEKRALAKTFFNLKKGSIISLMLALIMISLMLTSVYSHTISIGICIGLTNAIFNLVQTMSWDLSNVAVEYAKAKEFILDFSEFATLSEKSDALALPSRNPAFKFASLEFKDVSFAYPNTKIQILKNCSFKLTGNKKYGFVGVNGAGKTTIVKLLTGMYDNYDGEILINNIELKKYSPAELKGMIAVVFQDFARYSTTIEENIVNGDLNKKDVSFFNKVVSETGIKQLYKNLPQGVNTYLGKLKAESTDLSGGQWQRIAIARLLYADAPINILDEPTAALDPFEESRIYRLLEKASQNNFSIYITHRLGIVKNLDCILVLDNGAICEQGSHGELMTKKGIYYDIYNSQLKWYKTGEKQHE